MQLTNLSCISALKETTFIPVQMSIKFNRKSSMFAKLNLNKLKDKPNKKNLVLAKMLKLLNKL